MVGSGLAELGSAGTQRRALSAAGWWEAGEGSEAVEQDGRAVDPAAHSTKPFSHSRASASSVKILVGVVRLLNVKKRLAIALLRVEPTSRASALTCCIDSGLL